MHRQRTHYIKARIQAGDALWQKEIILLLITFSSCLIDAVTLYPVFEALFTETVYLIWITTLGSAAALDVSPVFIARLVQYVRFRKAFLRSSRVMHLVILSLSSVGFITLFLFLAKLRFATVDLLFQSSNLASNLTAGIVAKTSKATPAQEMTMYVMVMVNLSTSLATFICALLCSNPIRMRNLVLNVKMEELEERLNQSDAALSELDCDWASFLDSYDLDLYNAAVQSVDDGTQAIKNYARYLLAERLKDPVSINQCTEDTPPVPAEKEEKP